MKTNLTVLLMSLFCLVQCNSYLSAQVTIGSNNEPVAGAVLDLKENIPTNPSIDNSSSKKGMVLPRVELTSATNLFPMFEDDGTGGYKIGSESYTKAIEDLKHEGLIVYNLGGILEEGIYYWTGSKWDIAKGTEEPWKVSGTADIATSNNQNIYQKGSVTIGSSEAVDPTAILNVQSSSQGVLFPRITLKSSTDKVTIPDPTTGLLVYNTGNDPNFNTSGYMFWDGEAWKLFSHSTSESAIARLNCAGAQMTPSQQIIDGTDIIAGTILQIPYTGSNGGSFNGITLTSNGNPNVKATIADGMLSAGNGMLNFTLSGTPTLAQQAPNGITFDLTPFLDDNIGISGCNEVTIGNVLTASIEELAVMGYFMLTTDNTGNDTGTQYYALQCNSPDGKFSIRAEVPSSQSKVEHGNQYLNVQIRNNQDVAVPVIWNFTTDYSAAYCTAGVLTIPPMRWGGENNTGSSWKNATGSNEDNGVYWGQRGIYDATNNGPEYRRYTWIPQGLDSKVAYEAYIMVALDTLTPSTAVHPTKIKCYIKFSQVTAQ